MNTGQQRPERRGLCSVDHQRADEQHGVARFGVHVSAMTRPADLRPRFTVPGTGHRTILTGQ